MLLSFDLAGLERVPEQLTFDYRCSSTKCQGTAASCSSSTTGRPAPSPTRARSRWSSAPTTRQEFEIGGGRLRGFLAIVQLGTDHIWMGFDHVMFLVALLLPAVLVRKDGRWRDGAAFMPALINVVKIVTAFTVAHSVTLTLASLGIVRLPDGWSKSSSPHRSRSPRPTSCSPVFRGRVWLVVFGFGLFHGFGFAGALEEMGVLREHLALSLLGFNLGVEIGQLVIVMLLFPLLFALRRLAVYRQLLLPAAATLMIVVSMGWVVERALDVKLPGPGTVVSMAWRALS